MTPMELDVCVPPLFACPVSLDLMRDPVTLCTGMTYDRASIEQWLEEGHNTCPATNQLLSTQELIPNHTLRRLIQEWCVANSAHGIERIATPRQPAEPLQVKRLLHSIEHGFLQFESLRKLRDLAKESEKNRMCVSEAGGVPVLADSLGNLGMDLQTDRGDQHVIEACEDALGTIVLLTLSDVEKRALACQKPLACLFRLLSSGSLDAKVNAAEVLHSIAGVDSSLKVTVGSTPDVIQGLVRLLNEDLYPKGVHASLNCLLSLCSPKRNRLFAIEAGAIGALIELLPNAERGNTERTLALLEVLASCAEGREAIAKHALAIPMIVKFIRVGVSAIAIEHAMVALWAVLSFSSNRGVLHAALQAGAFAKVILVVQSGYSQRSKQKAGEILKLFNEVWRESSCRPHRTESLTWLVAPV